MKQKKLINESMQCIKISNYTYREKARKNEYTLIIN